ncbi:MAG: hypothetical protein MJ158_02725, partial [Alphaproteobacteria bacterium]|nr:hypothetical protein [Alphaproteobacteria bacterium]
MIKQMPGFDKHQADLEKKQQIVKEKQEIERKKREAQSKKEKAQALLNAKLDIISKNNESLRQKSEIVSFTKGFFVSDMIAFILGTWWFAGNDGPVDYPFGHEPLFTAYDMYGDMSFGQAVKNAYLLDDWRHGKGGVMQGICGLVSVLIAIGVGADWASSTTKTNEEKSNKAKYLLKELEQLKDYGVDTPKLVKDLTPSIKKILEAFSEIDRGFFDNLLAGGLDKANYETCVAIISGYLKSHPKEYNKVVEIIDEATLPEEIKKKYGKGKTISFAAAQ